VAVWWEFVTLTSKSSFRAIPTIYRGVQFRSRSEARWASLLDDLSVDWHYEPSGYEFDGVRYLPDFWLPNVLSRGHPGGVFFEVKVTYPTIEETRKAAGLAYGTGRPVIIVACGPSPPALESLVEVVRTPQKAWDDDGVMLGMTPCGLLDVGYHACSVTYCHCGCGAIDPCDPRLTEVRIAFPNYRRWEPSI
jgi:hypothetical protein